MRCTKRYAPFSLHVPLHPGLSPDPAFHQYLPSMSSAAPIVSQVWRVIRAVAVAKFSLADQLLLIEFWVAFVIPFFDIGAAVSVSELLAEVF